MLRDTQLRHSAGGQPDSPFPEGRISALPARGNTGRQRLSGKQSRTTRRKKGFQPTRADAIMQVGNLHLPGLPALRECLMAVSSPVSNRTSARQVNTLTPGSTLDALIVILGKIPGPTGGVQADNGAGYGSAFRQLFRERGVPAQTVNPRSPPADAAVERDRPARCTGGCEASQPHDPLSGFAPVPMRTIPTTPAPLRSGTTPPCTPHSALLCHAKPPRFGPAPDPRERDRGPVPVQRVDFRYLPRQSPPPTLRADVLLPNSPAGRA